MATTRPSNQQALKPNRTQRPREDFAIYLRDMSASALAQKPKGRPKKDRRDDLIAMARLIEAEPNLPVGAAARRVVEGRAEKHDPLDKASWIVRDSDSTWVNALGLIDSLTKEFRVDPERWQRLARQLDEEQARFEQRRTTIVADGLVITPRSNDQTALRQLAQRLCDVDLREVFQDLDLRAERLIDSMQLTNQKKNQTGK